MGFLKKAVRVAGIEPKGSTMKEKKDGSVDHRGQRGANRNPAQKAGDAKRRGPRSS